MRMRNLSNIKQHDESPLIVDKEEYSIVNQTSDDGSILDEDLEEEIRIYAGLSSWEKFKFKAKKCICRPRVYHTRTITIDDGVTQVNTSERSLPPNLIRNQKYNPITFIFVVLYEQFKYFFNLYYLVVALSQFIPALKIGYLFTYITPLAFVLSITLLKEAYDDFKRWQRDREVNSQTYQRITSKGPEIIPSSDIRVGDFIMVEKDMRVPADMILLRTTEKSGSCFIRTDQLDGETDWKLRRAIPSCQKLPSDESILKVKSTLYVTKPKKDIYNFVGSYARPIDRSFEKEEVESLSVENTLWMNTVVASGSAVGCVIYTGADTRSALNTSNPKTKVGLLDLELNLLSKLLFILVIILSFLMVALPGFKPTGGIDFFRFILLFSAIIPISLIVNLNMGKMLHSIWIMRDQKMPGTIARSSTIPEELGRISYLLTDKTGTLTQNDMTFRKLHIGIMSFSKDTCDDINDLLKSSYINDTSESLIFTEKKTKNSSNAKVRKIIEVLALCHNVTPAQEEEAGSITYQASSPDEVALVKFTESVGLTLWNRTLNTITLRNPLMEFMEFEVLNIFPFSSETKRMGIILRDKNTHQISFYMKGADVVMSKIVKPNDWLDEECGNMAREGLRTLVFGSKDFTEEEYEEFSHKYQKAKATIKSRDAKVQAVVESIENGLDLIGLSGVEDKLQDEVRPTLEMLQMAGIKIWMLTGDKIETATCIAVSARLIRRNQEMHLVSVGQGQKEDAYAELTLFRSQKDVALIIDGKTLQICLDFYKEMFIVAACQAPAVICCRCSPTQKAEIVKLIREHTKKQTAAIGDGGNDVSMIQAADVGIGIVGKEGKQASLAADYSITQFHYVRRLLIWHGRNCYKRSASLGQFVIHRGLIISFIQAVFSALYYFAAVAIYNGWLLVGYSTIYTMAPVFSLVLDEDVTEEIAFQFPELYKELQKGRVLSYKTFCIWVLKSSYQGGIIMLLSIILFDGSMYNIVSITFTTLVLTELLNVALEIRRWHYLMVISEVVTVLCYFTSMVVLKSYFDLGFILTSTFWWKVVAITLITCIPVYLGKFIRRKFFPPAYSKLS